MINSLRISTTLHGPRSGDSTAQPCIGGPIRVIKRRRSSFPGSQIQFPLYLAVLPSLRSRKGKRAPGKIGKFGCCDAKDRYQKAQYIFLLYLTYTHFKTNFARKKYTSVRTEWICCTPIMVHPLLMSAAASPDRPLTEA